MEQSLVSGCSDDANVSITHEVLYLELAKLESKESMAPSQYGLFFLVGYKNKVPPGNLDPSQQDAIYRYLVHSAIFKSREFTLFLSTLR